jgi:hypothetical protein
MSVLSEIRDSDWAVKGLIVSFAIAIVGAAGALSGSKSKPAAGSSSMVVLKCMDPACGHVEHYTNEQLSQIIQQRNQEYMKSVPGDESGMMPMMVLPWGDRTCPLRCSKCNKDSFVRHLECPKDGTFYLHDYTKKPNDACPKCGYSPSQERLQQRKKNK